MSPGTTSQTAWSTKSGLTSAEVEVEMQKYLNNWARLLEPFNARDGSLKAACVEDSKVDDPVGTAISYHTGGCPHWHT
jgi:hypothetical protein